MSAGDDDPIASPCVSVCVMDAGGKYCTGCLRTLAEIAHWTAYSAAERRLVLERVLARRGATLAPH
jgi:predicted Fe-S protein YdhL (DUF1289 family)